LLTTAEESSPQRHERQERKYQANEARKLPNSIARIGKIRIFCIIASAFTVMALIVYILLSKNGVANIPTSNTSQVTSVAGSGSPSASQGLQLATASTSTDDVIQQTSITTAVPTTGVSQTSSAIRTLPITDLDTGQLSYVWYFANGSTQENNKTWLIFYNPQNNQSQVTIRYFKDDGKIIEQGVTIPGNSGYNLDVSKTLPNITFGVGIYATQQIIVERTISGPGISSTTTPGQTKLNRRWFFAAGTTKNPFQTRVFVLNPNAQSVRVVVTFSTFLGTTLTREYQIPPTTYLAIDVNKVVPDLDVTTTIEADRLVVAEQTLYQKLE
jgi:hypothetical protein